jgi:hypothetical protein
MTLDKFAWQAGGIAQAGVTLALTRTQDLAGLAALATMRQVTDARRLLVARTVLGALHTATPPIARFAGASTAVAVLITGRVAIAALRAPARVLTALTR